MRIILESFWNSGFSPFCAGIPGLCTAVSSNAFVTSRLPVLKLPQAKKCRRQSLPSDGGNKRAAYFLFKPICTNSIEHHERMYTVRRMTSSSFLYDLGRERSTCDHNLLIVEPLEERRDTTAIHVSDGVIHISIHTSM